MADIVTIDVGFQGPAGALSPEDRARVETAVRAGASLTEALAAVDAARRAASDAADRAGASGGQAAQSAQDAAAQAQQSDTSAAAALRAAEDASAAAGRAGTAAGDAVAAAARITGMQVAPGAPGSAPGWDGQTLTVPQGLTGPRGRGVTVVVHETEAEMLAAAAGDSLSDDPLVLRIVPMDVGGAA